MLVLIHHSQILGQSVVDLGSLGVYIFFNLSGYLIVPIFFKQMQNSDGFHDKLVQVRKFFKARALRIFPAYYFCLTFLALPLFAYSHFRRTALSNDYAGIFPYLYTYTTNFYIAYVSNAWPGPVSHFWSLAVEQQFYIFFPLFFVFLPVLYWKRAMIVLFTIFCFLALSVYNTSIQFYVGTFTGFFAVIAGGVAALTKLEMRTPLPSYFLLSAASAIFLIAPIIGYSHLGIILGTIMISLFLKSIECQPNGWFTRILECRFLRGLGVISYGFYVYHNLMLVPAVVIAKHIFSVAELPLEHYVGYGYYLTVLTIAFLLTIIISALSFVLIESPVRRFGS